MDDNAVVTVGVLRAVMREERVWIGERFDSIDKRFEAVDGRFASLERSINSRFAEADQKIMDGFDGVFRCLDRMENKIDDIAALKSDKSDIIRIEKRLVKRVVALEGKVL